MTAWYNENEPFAAAWLRNLIAAGHIAPGDVDERDIRDVRPDDLRPYTQCHFFAGIGVWSYALRCAGWPDHRRVWTGSCPCQPFSKAGRGAGFADERHLWPAFHHLIRLVRPGVVFGEQVAPSDGLAWLDLVSADLEGEGYAFRAVDTCAAGFGAPHIRQRLYWVADADQGRRAGLDGQGQVGAAEHRPDSRLADDDSDGCPAASKPRLHDAQRHAQPRGYLVGLDDDLAFRRGPRRPDNGRHDGVVAGPAGTAIGLGDSPGPRPQERPLGPDEHGVVRLEGTALGPTGALHGPWTDADWLYCTDGRWRPVEPGTRPLAHGVAGRVGQLRAYGNAIVAEQARGFVEAYLSLETQPLRLGVLS